ncbi:MAG: metallophosphoesterase [Bacteroidetes bacterium]|nr:metallophosphoesterase [Bacteroidota bacterium]
MKLGIVSDIHEDAVSLEIALVKIENHNCDRVICLGDTVGFSYPNFGFFDTRNASRCIELINTHCSHIVAGNHDLYPIRRIPQHNAGFNYPPYWYQLDYQERKKLAGDDVWLNEENEFDPLLESTDREFLSQLPEFVIVDAGRIKLLFSHYLFPDLTGSHRKYYRDFGPVKPHLDFMDEKGCQIGISGHQHVEGARIFYADKIVDLGFGSLQLQDELQWIVGPCIANGKRDNGFMILDTESFELEVIPLHSPKRIMQVVYI